MDYQVFRYINHFLIEKTFKNETDVCQTVTNVFCFTDRIILKKDLVYNLTLEK